MKIYFFVGIFILLLAGCQNTAVPTSRSQQTGSTASIRITNTQESTSKASINITGTQQEEVEMKNNQDSQETEVTVNDEMGDE